MITSDQERKMEIRDARQDDIEEITAIHNHAVEHTTAIWSETKIDAANCLTWFADRQRVGYPVLVAVGGESGMLGYASFGDWRARDGYRHTVEHSVYVRADQRRKGIGKALMLALIERAWDIGKHVMVACIETGNETSIRLQEKLGFQRVGYLKQVSTKFGIWLDLTFLQLTARSEGSRTYPPTTPPGFREGDLWG
jgi:phosphinothricin acetyltransferase